MAVSPTFFATPAAWRAWLAANHASAKELLVGFHKTHTGTPCMTWSESVDEALCFGWIDGVRKSIDATAYTIRFTPRKPTSIWSAINVAKVEALRAAGKMQPAGEAAFAKRTAARTGVYSFERAQAAQLSPAQAAQLAAHASAHAWFTAQAPSYQRAALHWVVSAKQEATRERRLAELIGCSAKGERIPPLRGWRAPHAKARAAKPAPAAKRASATKAAPAAKPATASRPASAVKPASASKPAPMAKPARRATSANRPRSRPAR